MLDILQSLTRNLDISVGWKNDEAHFVQVLQERAISGERSHKLVLCTANGSSVDCSDSAWLTAFKPVTGFCWRVLVFKSRHKNTQQLFQIRRNSVEM